MALIYGTAGHQLRLTAMADTAGQWHVLSGCCVQHPDCYGQHRRPVARSKWLLYAIPHSPERLAGVRKLMLSHNLLDTPAVDAILAAIPGQQYQPSPLVTRTLLF